MFKSIARKPFKRIGRYLKFECVIAEHEFYCCPRCREKLNAGPMYQPKYCSECGQKLSFKGAEWKEDREIGYKRIIEGRDNHASVQN